MVEKQMAIRYTDSLDGLLPGMLEGFFVGWPNSPSPQTHLEILRSSAAVMLAVDDETEQVVGFVTALSDGVLSAYLPLLEVLPQVQGQGIGRELVRRILEKLQGLYAVDLVCDDDLVPFYERFGFKPGRGMMLRNYDLQAGASTD